MVQGTKEEQLTDNSWLCFSSLLSTAPDSPDRGTLLLFSIGLSTYEQMLIIFIYCDSLHYLSPSAGMKDLSGQEFLSGWIPSP